MESPPSKRIQAIDKSSIHRICSGQVIVDLSIAVKELLENSLDAGATSIDIRFREYGMESIEVIDNGSGIQDDDFATLAKKHFTSKISNFEDLAQVSSFGFRGEALSSLCAISRFSVQTRTSGQVIGVKLEYDNHGELVSKTPVSRERGSTVTVSDLFEALPVRHKEFKKNLKREYAKCLTLIQSYALISVGVRITCSNQPSTSKTKNVVLTTAGGKDLKDNIVNVLGSKQVQTIEAFDFEIGLDQNKTVKASGYVSKPAPGSGRNTTDRQYFFINGRPVDLPKFVKVINEVYRQYNFHQYPFLLMTLKMKTDSYDVNVTPDKRTIFVHEERQLLESIRAKFVEFFEPSRGSFDRNGGQERTLDTFLNRTRSDGSQPESTTPKVKKAHSFPGFSSSQEQDEDTEQRRPFFLPKFSSANIPLEDEPEGETEEKINNLTPQSPSERENRRWTPEEEGSPVSLKRASSLFAGDNDARRKFVKIDFGKSKKKATDRTAFLLSKYENSNPLLSLHTIQEDDEEEGEDAVVDDHHGHSHQHDHSDEGEDHRRHHHHVGPPAPVFEKKVEPRGQVSDDESENEFSPRSPPNHEILQLRESLRQALADDEEIMSEAEPLTGQSHHSQHFSQGAKVSVPVGDGSSERSPDVTLSFDMSRYKKQAAANNNSEDPAAPTKEQRFFANLKTDDNKAIEELNKKISKNDFCQMQIIGQFNLGFIIVKLVHGRQSDLFIIDQHATDEKYNFETLQRETVMNTQRLIVPRRLELTPQEEVVVMENIEILRKNGFDFEVDEGAQASQKLRLISQPYSKNTSFGVSDLEELVVLLQDRPGEMVRCSKVRSMFASRACRKSVMIGTALNVDQMKKIVRHMSEIEQPWNCPHGRPTMRHLFDLSARKENQ